MYVGFMGIICFLPYTEEIFRCLRVRLSERQPQ
jgi:hypothetical protein